MELVIDVFEVKLCKRGLSSKETAVKVKGQSTRTIFGPTVLCRRCGVVVDLV